MKKLLLDTVISSIITVPVSVLLYILTPILGSIIPIEITAAFVTVVAFVFVFIGYRYVRSGDGEKLIHKDYPMKTGVYSFKSDLKTMLKEERSAMAVFGILTVVAHIILDIAFYYKSNSFIIQAVTFLLYPFGISSGLLNYFKVPDSMLAVAAILLFAVNIVLICVLYIIILSVRRRKWAKNWLQNK